MPIKKKELEKLVEGDLVEVRDDKVRTLYYFRYLCDGSGRRYKNGSTNFLKVSREKTDNGYSDSTVIFLNEIESINKI